VINFSNVSKQYGSGQKVLQGVTFSIERNQMAFITGPSGAGKTTLLKIITLQERPTRGRVFIDDQNISMLSGRKIAYYRRTIGVVHQDHKLLFDRNVSDNVALPLLVKHESTAKIRRNIHGALEMVGLQGKENAYPIDLSGGEQQRVGIARAIVTRPKVLIADEPTGNLDLQLGEDIMKIFQNLTSYGTTVLVATHEPRHNQGRNFLVLKLQNGHLRSGHFF